MPAYIITEIEVTDPVVYEEYRHGAAGTIERFGGRYLVRGGRAELLEGDDPPRRMIVLEFASAERAKAWWSSQEYAGPKETRQRSARTRMILVDGA